MAEESHVFSTEQENISDNQNKKVEKTILENFSKITNKQFSVRVKSSLDLLQYLSQVDEENPEVKYAFDRLIRGLGASTTNARSGFYTTLIGLLNLRNDFGVTEIQEISEKQLHVSSSNSKGEKGDISIGQVLLCGSIIRSNLFQRSSQNEQKKVLEQLFTASKEKTYLKLLTYSFVVDLLETLSENDFKKIVFPFIKSEIMKDWSEHNLDSLYLLLKVKGKYESLLKGIKLGENNLKELSSILMTIPRITAIKHPVYVAISEELTANSHNLSQFFTEIDVYLLKPNRNRFLITTELFSNILRNIKDSTVIPNLLTRNYIQQLLNNFKSLKMTKKDPEFCQIIQNFFNQLINSLKVENVPSEVKINVLKRLQFSPGSFVFEKITKSKTIQQITAILDSDGVQSLAKIYQDVVSGEQLDKNDNWFNNDRLYAAHLLVKLLNHPSIHNNIEFRVEGMKFLMDLSLMKNEAIGCELAASLKGAFYNALDMKLSKLEDLQMVLSKLVHHLNSKLNADNLSTVLRTPLSSESYDLWMKTINLVDKIEKKKKKKLRLVFLILFLNIGLQLFNDSKLAADVLNELFNCYERTKKSNDDTINEMDVNESQQDPLWIEVVIDLFLNLLSHNSHLLRSLVNCVFPHLCQYMNGSAVHQLLSVFDVKNDTDLLENEDDTSDEEENDVSDIEESEEETSNDDEEDDETENETVNEKMRMALHKALTENGYGSDQDSVDLNDLSDSEGEKLNKTLAEVFKQFKPNRGKTKKQTKDQETLMHFRVRVLDLIQIYLDSSPPMLLVLEIMLPLLQTVEYSIRDDHQRPLFTRLKSCLKKLSLLKKFSNMDDVNEQLLVDLLKSFLDKGSKNALIIQEMNEQISDCCLFVVKCSQLLLQTESTPKKLKKQLKNSIGDVIVNALETYFNKRDCLTPYVLFKSILQINWTNLIVLVEKLYSYIFNEEIKPFRRAQATELLKLFYTNHRYLENQTIKTRKQLADVHETFSNDVIAFFESAHEKQNVKERFVSNLFSLLSNIKSSPFNEHINWLKIGPAVQEYRSSVTLANDTKKAYNKLCSSLGISNIVKMKTKVVKLNGLTKDELKDDQLKKKEKKKKQKSKSANKLKKESKTLRLQSLSEGFSNGIVFEESENIDMDDLSDLENDDVTPKKRKTEQLNGVSKKKMKL